MNATATSTIDQPGRHPVPPEAPAERRLSPAQWGMVSFLTSEVALFSTLIVTYIYYLGKEIVGPSPAEALSLAVVPYTTVCLLGSSGTIHLAESRLKRGSRGGFIRWWAATIVLGALFLGGTGIEWRDLIVDHHLTIGRNLFGTTFYTLVGLHALHVTGGVVLLSLVFALALRRGVTTEHRTGVELVSWYWHFVDAVWVVVFTVVYVVGR